MRLKTYVKPLLPAPLPVKPGPMIVSRFDRLERFRIHVCAELARIVLEVRELRETRKGRR
jgi:hypothetical protein